MYDDRYGHPGEFAIARCPGCGFMSTDPRFDDADLPDLYSRYYPRRRTTAEDVRRVVKAMGIDTRRGRLRVWLSGKRSAHYEVAPDMRVLDYGCGDCTSLLEIRALGAEPYGIEVDPNVRDIAEALGLPIHLGPVEMCPEPDASFDAVTLSQVVEHVPDPARLLNALYAKLKPAGVVVLTTPNSRALSRYLCGRRWLNWHIPFHQNHFNAATTRRLLDRAGFVVKRIRTFTPVPWWEYQAELLLRPAVQGCPHPFFDRGQSVIRASRLGRVLLWPARAVAIVFARLVDILGFGDSLLVTARKR
jgi:SAM-dependent methyltransferase